MSKPGKAERTRRALLDVAWALMLQRGAEVSMAEVAQAADVTRQNLYAHFGSRSGLLVALVRRTDERMGIAAALNAALATPDPTARLDACLETWLRFLAQVRPVASDLYRMRATDTDAAAAWTDRMGELRRFFGRLSRSLVRDGALRDGLHATEAADLIYAHSSLAMWDVLTQERKWKAERAAQAMRSGLAQLLLRTETAHPPK